MNENEQMREMEDLLYEIEQGFIDYCDKPCAECEHNKFLRCVSKYKAEQLYAKGYRKVERGEWISVEDRLPDNDRRMLVYLGNNHHVKTDTDRYFGYWARWGENVTHWMPLPEPPSRADMRGE